MDLLAWLMGSPVSDHAQLQFWCPHGILVATRGRDWATLLGVSQKREEWCCIPALIQKRLQHSSFSTLSKGELAKS